MGKMLQLETAAVSGVAHGLLFLFQKWLIILRF